MEVPITVWAPSLTGPVTPHRRRHLSAIEQGQLRAQAQDWLKRGITEEAPTPLPWTLNTVHVRKHDGRTRVCIDATPVNDVTEDFDWPLPRLQDLRHHTRGWRWFSRMDLKDAFFRIEVPTTWRNLTAFESDGKTYRFRRMPFGLKTAPSVFQRFMDHTLAAHKGSAFWYIDDVIVGARTLSGLRAAQVRVRSSLISAGCTINEDKSEYEKQGLLFSGIWIFSGGVGPNESQVTRLMQMAPPQSKEEKQSVLGLVSYLRDHIPFASELTAILSVAKGARTGPVSEALWRSLLGSIAATISSCAHWDDDRDGDLYTDGSKTGCSAVLMQDGRIVALASRKFIPAETRYSTTDREHLGLVLAAKKFRLMLHRPKGVTHVWTDHTSLLNRTGEGLTPRQQRWRNDVNQWIPRLQHVKGKSNPADFFSRWDLNVQGGQISCI